MVEFRKSLKRECDYGEEMVKIFKDCYKLRELTKSLRESNALNTEEVISKSFVMSKPEAKEASKPTKSKVSQKQYQKRLRKYYDELNYLMKGLTYQLEKKKQIMAEGPDFWNDLESFFTDIHAVVSVEEDIEC